MAYDLRNPADPAIGNQLSITIAANKTQVLRALFFEFTTSATAGNRYVELWMEGSGGTLWRVEVPVAQPASTLRQYSFAIGNAMTTSTPNDNIIQMPLPTIALPAGFFIETDVGGVFDSNATTGDAFTLVYCQLQDVSPFDTPRI